MPVFLRLSLEWPGPSSLNVIIPLYRSNIGGVIRCSLQGGNFHVDLDCGGRRVRNFDVVEHPNMDKENRGI